MQISSNAPNTYFILRYGDNPDAGNEDDVFQRLMREADEREEARAAEANAGPTQSQV